jgi:hypothetical protein
MAPPHYKEVQESQSSQLRYFVSETIKQRIYLSYNVGVTIGTSVEMPLRAEVKDFKYTVNCANHVREPQVMVW